MKKAVIITAIVLIIGFFFLIPWITRGYTVSFIASLFLFLALSQAWNIFSGYSGYIAFGQIAFFGIGAYSTFILINNFGIPFYFSFILGSVLTVVIVAIIGPPLLKIRGPYFSIISLAFLLVTKAVVENWPSLTGGGVGLEIPPVYTLTTYYYFIFGLALIINFSSYLIRRLPYGLRLLSIKCDEDASENSGVNTSQVKISAFIISSFFFAFIGGVWAWNQTAIDPSTVFDLNMQILVIVIVVFGGIGTVIGPILGNVVLIIFQEILWIRYPYLYMLILAVIIITAIRFTPNGIMGMLRKSGFALF